jgi:glycosyltransferase involved in cell wall biosynthesis
MGKIMCSLAQIRIEDGKLVREKNMFNRLQVLLKEKHLSLKLKGQSEPVIQIGDFQRKYKNQYIYQDLSIDSIIDLKETKPWAYKYAPFTKSSTELFKWRANFQKEVYDNCKGIFTMSHWLREHLINYTGIPAEKVHYVGAGINLDINKITNEKRYGNKILFVGRDFYRKGGDLVVKAFLKLKEEMPEAELYVAGPKQKPIEICENSESIVFLGDISYDDLSRYFNMCDIFCMPSRFEPFGLVYIEALVYGMPCIVNNDFAMKEVVQDGVNGYLLSNENIDDLKEKMKLLLHNEAIKKNVFENREQYIKEYSWDTVAERMVNIIVQNENDI